MENRWTLSKALLLVISFFSFQSASLYAESRMTFSRLPKIGNMDRFPGSIKSSVLFFG